MSNEWRGERECPMPVLRSNFNDEDDETVVTERCGEVLIFTVTGSESIENGPLEIGSYSYPHWQIECAGHHVLLVGDNEGNGREVPFRPGLAERVLDMFDRIEWVADSAQAANPEGGD